MDDQSESVLKELVEQLESTAQLLTGVVEANEDDHRGSKFLDDLEIVADMNHNLALAINDLLELTNFEEELEGTDGE